MCPVPLVDPFASPWNYDGTWQARLLVAIGQISGGGGGTCDLTQVEALLTSIDSKDFSTEATLEAVRVLIESIEGKDFATEATLTSIYNILSGGTIQVDTGLDLSPLATEATLGDINAKLNSLGQKTMAGSVPVVLPSDQVIPISGTITAQNFEDKLLQVDSVGSTTYLGYANAGTLTASATWAIKKIVETGSDVSMTWADGNNSFDNIWDNRLALTYS